MKNISAWAIRHPLPPIVLFVVLLFMGLVSFVRLPVTADPDISFPGVTVTIEQPGAAPQELETQVLQKVEGAIAGIGNLDNITSWAVEGQAFIFVQFELGTPVDRAVADVRDAVAKVRVLLPQGIQEPVVQRVNADGGPMEYYAVSSSSLTEEELSWFVDNTITKRLLNVTGVAQVQRGGGVNREIRVELDPARMQALGITAAEVNEQLRTLNLDTAGGRAQLGNGEQAIRVLGGARTAAALAGAQITLSGGRFARLADLAEVRDSVGEIRSMARLDGRPATTFGVVKAKGYSDVSVDAAVQEELAKIRKENPQVKMTLDLHQRRLHQGHLPLRAQRAGGRLDPRGAGGVPVPARHRAPRSSRRSPSRCPRSRRSPPCCGWTSRSTRSACSPCRWWPGCWWTMRSSRSRTSCVTCAWARAPTRRRSMPPTRSDLRWWRPRPPSSRCSCR